MNVLSGFENFVRPRVSLAPLTWLRVGGAAEYLAEPTSVEELRQLVVRCREANLPVRMLGSGSNVLVRDEGVSGVVVRLIAPVFTGVKIVGNTLEAGGGAALAHVISTAVRHGLGGLEPLTGIPGTIGGAVRGNSSTHGGDIGQYIKSVDVLTHAGELITRGREELHFAYRQSNVDDMTVLAAQFELEPEDSEELTRRMQKLWIVKRASQPMGEENVGCVFKHPRGLNAQTLLEQAGLKGASVGRAEICDQHENYVVTHSGATASDVRKLIELMRTRVAERLGVQLELQMDLW